MNYNENLTFTINQVAKKIGVVPATIRNWEKNGLIEVKRSSSNYRIFTLDDIEKLKKIKDYSIDKHMGTKAIQMLLSSKGNSALEEYVDQKKEIVYSKKLISEKWRHIRKQQGYTLEDVSKATGISITHLSHLENGGNVSLDIMNKLAHFYQENPLVFFEEADADEHVVRNGFGEPIKLKDDPGLEMQSLVSMRDHIMYPVICTVQPGSGNMIPHTHKGEEFIYIISGVFEFILNDDPPYILYPGDSFYHHGSDLHSWRNVSPKTARLLWVHSAVSKK